MDDRTHTMKAREAVQGARKPGLRAYRDLFYGRTSLAYVLKAELLTAWFGSMSGAAGLFFRGRFYRGLFGSAGRRIFVGRNVMLRHAKRIFLGNNVILDDNCVLDAKGDTARGIVIGDNAFIGRNTLIYCRNGDVEIGAGASISSNCTIFSSNRLAIGAGTLIGGYSYLLSGGEYDFGPDAPPFVEQAGTKSKGDLVIGPNCWLGARVTVLDAASIGEGSVIGAGAVVTKPISSRGLALGVPARVVRTI